MINIQLIIAAVVGYLLGSLNSSLLVGKAYGVDIRKHGSGNAGTTNALRTLGKKAAAFVLLGDALKGVLAYLVGYLICSRAEGLGVLGGMLSGTAAVIGHIWPLYFGFKGGKGVLTSLAVLIMIDWPIAVSLLALFIIIVIISKYVSLGSVIAAAIFPLMAVLLGRSTETVIFSGIIALMIIIKHHANIKRILAGTESKLSFKSKK